MQESLYSSKKSVRVLLFLLVMFTGLTVISVTYLCFNTFFDCTVGILIGFWKIGMDQKKSSNLLSLTKQNELYLNRSWCILLNLILKGFSNGFKVGLTHSKWFVWLTSKNFLIVDSYIISSPVRPETISAYNNVLGSARVHTEPSLQVQHILQNVINLLSWNN